MAITVQQIHPVAHLPLVLGVLRRLEVAAVIDHLIPPHPAHGLSCGRGVEALVLAILDGHHALYNPTTPLSSALRFSALTMREIRLVIAPLDPGHKGEALLNRIRMQGQHDFE